jgi:antitoxin (DNA-binding transcriptional repressor) of toxin-antitoxin stability system
MKYVSTAELKAKLSHYLGMVREGSSLYVTHHQQPVAELSPVSDANLLTIGLPDQPVHRLSEIKGVSLPDGHRGEGILLEDRGRR